MENTLLYIFTFFIGAILGSFGSVLLTRLENPTRKNIKSIITGRSHCPFCETKLSPQSLIPIVSFWIQKGKCKHCSEAIPTRYPQLEISSAIVVTTTFVLLRNITPLSEVIIWSTLNRLLTLLIVFDFRKQLLHSSIRILSLIPILGLVFTHGVWTQSITSSIVFIIPTLLIYGGAKRRAKRKHGKKEGLGQGDIYLLGSLGLVVPIILTMQDIQLGTYEYITFYLRTLIIGSIITLIHHFLANKKQKEIAFIPGLVIGFRIVSTTLKHLI